MTFEELSAPFVFPILLNNLICTIYAVYRQVLNIYGVKNIFLHLGHSVFLRKLINYRFNLDPQALVTQFGPKRSGDLLLKHIRIQIESI